VIVLSNLTDLREAYGKTLAQLGEENENIVVLDADLSGSTKTSVFGKKFPHRFFNMGVAEQNMISTAAGLAAAGKIAFASTFAVFASGRAWEQIRYSVAYNRLNVKIVASHGGITVGPDGGSHQCAEDIAIMRVLPSMRVIVPGDGIEMREVIKAVAEIPGPFYVRGSRVKFPALVGENYRFQLGKGVVLRDGRDVTLIGTGLMVSKCLEAAEVLDQEGISTRVVNMSTIKPLDEELVIDCAAQTQGIVTAEEHSIIGGLGSAVAEVLGEKLPAPLVRIGVRDSFGHSGTADELLDLFGLSSRSIVMAAKQTLGMHRGERTMMTMAMR